MWFATVISIREEGRGASKAYFSFSPMSPYEEVVGGLLFGKALVVE